MTHCGYEVRRSLFKMRFGTEKRLVQPEPTFDRRQSQTEFRTLRPGSLDHSSSARI